MYTAASMYENNKKKKKVNESSTDLFAYLMVYTYTYKVIIQKVMEFVEGFVYNKNK